MNLSLDTFGHDDEIGRLFEEYDRLVRWEEHNSRPDATDPVVERAIARGRIVAFIANTATLQQDAHTSMNAEPEPQDVEEARKEYDRRIIANEYADMVAPEYVSHRAVAEQWTRPESAIRADERKRWAEREQQLVEALRPFAELATCYCDEFWLRDYHRHGPNCFWADYADDIAQARAVLNQERPA